MFRELTSRAVAKASVVYPLRDRASKKIAMGLLIDQSPTNYDRKMLESGQKSVSLICTSHSLASRLTIKYLLGGMCPRLIQFDNVDCDSSSCFAISCIL